MDAKNDLTKNSIIKTVITFSIPFLLANLIQALYGAADLMVIGWYCSAESVAAVSTGTQVTQIITSIVSGLTLGGTLSKNDNQNCALLCYMHRDANCLRVYDKYIYISKYEINITSLWY